MTQSLSTLSSLGLAALLAASALPAAAQTGRPVLITVGSEVNAPATPTQFNYPRAQRAANTARTLTLAAFNNPEAAPDQDFDSARSPQDDAKPQELEVRGRQEWFSDEGLRISGSGVSLKSKF